MTEEQWLTCTRPLQMEQFLEGRVSHRKARLYACACCRLIWDLLTDERSRAGVDVAERLADGQATTTERDRAYRRARAAHRACGFIYDVPGIPTYALRATPVLSHIGASTANHSGIEDEAFCELLVEVIGSPFRPVRQRPTDLPAPIITLAAGAYEDRALPSGHLDNARLAVLSDALEESGCTDATILTHLRSPGPHVRGCWVLDLVLGKG